MPSRLFIGPRSRKLVKRVEVMFSRLTVFWLPKTIESCLFRFQARIASSQFQTPPLRAPPSSL